MFWDTVPDAQEKGRRNLRSAASVPVSERAAIPMP
jgi:hypothetical protein